MNSLLQSLCQWGNDRKYYIGDLKAGDCLAYVVYFHIVHGVMYINVYLPFSPFQSLSANEQVQCMNKVTYNIYTMEYWNFITLAVQEIICI